MPLRQKYSVVPVTLGAPGIVRIGRRNIERRIRDRERNDAVLTSQRFGDELPCLRRRRCEIGSLHSEAFRERLENRVVSNGTRFHGGVPEALSLLLL